MIVGIDLGTTNSLVATFEGGVMRLLGPKGRQMVPSVVSVLDNALLVGETAKNRLVTHPTETVATFKRGMGTDQRYQLGSQFMSAVELSALVLRHLREIAEADLGQSVHDAVISVPAYFNQLQRKAVYSAAEIADLNPLRLINEPTAAAIAYGLQDIRNEGSLLVFDLGGGTFDVSIVEVFEGVIEVRATAGDAFLGGEDFTAAIANHFAKEHDLPNRSKAAEAQLWALAETVKHRLASEPIVEATATVGDKELTTTLSREMFEEICQPLIQRLQRPVLRALHDAGLAREDIARVVLVGGATRMPLIRGLVARLVQKLPEIGLDPDHVVALGAAAQAALTNRNAALEDVVMTDVTAFSLGIETAHRVGEQLYPGYFNPIIERNTVVPVSREKTFSSVEKGQRILNVKVYQGEAPMTAQNIEIGTLSVNLPPSREEYEQVRVRFTYDVSGLLEVDTEVVSSGQVQSLLISELTSEMTEKEIAERRAALRELKVHPKDVEENLRLKARIERCYALALSDDRDGLQTLLKSFDATLERQDLNEIESAREEISVLLDRFEAHYVR